MKSTMLFYIFATSLAIASVQAAVIFPVEPQILVGSYILNFAKTFFQDHRGQRIILVDSADAIKEFYAGLQSFVASGGVSIGEFNAAASSEHANPLQASLGSWLAHATAGFNVGGNQNADASVKSGVVVFPLVGILNAAKGMIDYAFDFAEKHSGEEIIFGFGSDASVEAAAYLASLWSKMQDGSGSGIFGGTFTGGASDTSGSGSADASAGGSVSGGTDSGADSADGNAGATGRFG